MTSIWRKGYYLGILFNGKIREFPLLEIYLFYLFYLKINLVEKRIVGFENSKFGVRGILENFDLEFFEVKNEKVKKNNKFDIQTIF